MLFATATNFHMSKRPKTCLKNFLCTCSLLAGGAAQETGKSLMLSKHCIATALLSPKIQITASYESLQRTLTLSQPKPWHLITAFLFKDSECKIIDMNSCRQAAAVKECSLHAQVHKKHSKYCQICCSAFSSSFHLMI